MSAKFVLKKTSDGQFMFNLRATNGEVILTSELYKAKASAENGIESIKTNSSDDPRYSREESRKGEPYFVLKAANGEIIGRSEMYSSAQAMEKGTESVKANGPIASVDDQT